MAQKQFALPLDSSSKQTGDISLQKLIDNNAPVEFRTTNVSSSGANQLNLITCKNGDKTDHIFSATVSSGIISTTLTVAQLGTVKSDADGGDWDYVDAEWTAGAFDVPSASVMYAMQGNRTYDTYGWPPDK